MVKTTQDRTSKVCAKFEEAGSNYRDYCLPECDAIYTGKNCQHFRQKVHFTSTLKMNVADASKGSVISTLKQFTIYLNQNKRIYVSCLL
jgi:uncharacterized protein YmfQ (DUF2313 family)